MKVFGISLLGALLLVAGCGDETIYSEREVVTLSSDLPEDLLGMQGTWSSGEENRLEIKDRTIRFLFRFEETGQLYRRNVYIEGVDESLHSLDIRGEAGRWYYSLSEESLNLQFFDRDNTLWVGSTMIRDTPGDQIAIH